MPTFKLTASQKISVTADIIADQREAAIDELASLMHKWIASASGALLAKVVDGAVSPGSISTVSVKQNEGGWNILDENEHRVLRVRI